MNNKSIIVVGAGLSGAVIAHEAALKGYKVDVYDKRPTVAGNCFDTEQFGTNVHMYGPHIFHTDNERVYNYMNQFWELNDFKNRVNGVLLKSGNIFNVPIPFNFEGIDAMFPENRAVMKKALVDRFGANARVSIADLLESDDELIKELADYVYKNVFENYTTKMWGKTPDEIDKSVLKRVPVVLSYDKRYFSNKYEGLPKEGYTTAIELMLKHENIKLHLNWDWNLHDAYDATFIGGKVFYSGALDKLFEYKYGVLDYRSLRIDYEIKTLGLQTNKAVTNYPAHRTMTRCTNYSIMNGASFYGTKDLGRCLLAREFPGKYDKDSKDFNEPYYPIPNEESRVKYKKYLNDFVKFHNDFYPIGRLGTYKYLNMDDAIKAALELADVTL